MDGWDRLTQYVATFGGSLTRTRDAGAWTVRLYADSAAAPMLELRNLFYTLYRFWHYHDYLEQFRIGWFALDVRISMVQMREIEDMR